MGDALYNKFRPQTYSDVIGQDVTVNALTNMIKLDRIPNGILLTGNRGLGKTTLAKIFAKVLNCTDLTDGEPCCECDSCIGIANGKSMDVIELDGASNRGIDTIREQVINKVGFKPKYKYKVIIIDEVHMLTTEAWNGLLKTLEEPPSYCVFVFCTTNPEKIPKTIMSRLMTFHLNDMTVDNIVSRLTYICKTEKFKYEKEALYLISRYAKGGMRDSISALDQVSISDVTAENVAQTLGIISDDVCLDLLSEILGKNMAGCVELVDSFINNGYNVSNLYDNVVKLARMLFKIIHGIKTCDSIANADISQDTFDKLLSFNETIDVTYMNTFIKIILDKEKEFKFACDKQLSFLSIIDDLINSNSSDLNIIFSRLDKLEKMMADGYCSDNSNITQTISNIKSLVSNRPIRKKEVKETVDEVDKDKLNNLNKWFNKV